MAGLPEITCLGFVSKHHEVYIAKGQRDFFPSSEQFPVIQESIRTQVQSAAVATVMSDLLIQAAGTTPGCQARPGWRNLHLPARSSEGTYLAAT